MLSAMDEPVCQWAACERAALDCGLCEAHLQAVFAEKRTLRKSVAELLTGIAIGLSAELVVKMIETIDESFRLSGPWSGVASESAGLTQRPPLAADQQVPEQAQAFVVKAALVVAGALGNAKRTDPDA